MKNIISIITLFVCLITFAAEIIPGTANSFLEINTYRTPIVTNAEEAIYAVMSPIGAKISIPSDYDDPYDGKIRCYPNRMNVITNSVNDLIGMDEIEVTFISNFRTGKIYFGPEYSDLITKTKSGAITLKPDGLLFNGSTNCITVTNVPAIIKFTSFLGTNLWVNVDYPTFITDDQKKITNTDEDKDEAVDYIYEEIVSEYFPIGENKTIIHNCSITNNGDVAALVIQKELYSPGETTVSMNRTRTDGNGRSVTTTVAYIVDVGSNVVVNVDVPIGSIIESIEVASSDAADDGIGTIIGNSRQYKIEIFCKRKKEF